MMAAMSSQNISEFIHWGRNVTAVGWNYRDHCAELGNAVPTKPFLFMKPPLCYLEEGTGPIQIPRGCTSCHHEVELGVVIGETCRDVPEEEVMARIAGYALALDMTARDFQAQAKKKGSPWALAKCFDTALPVSRFLSTKELADPTNIKLWCKVNEEMRQNGTTSDMVFSIPYLISYMSRHFTLHRGDLVLTGTPAGVGPVQPGDVISAGLGDIVTMKFNVVQRDMMPKSFLTDNGVTSIVGGGSALMRNPILHKELEDMYELPVTLDSKGDAAYGSALAAINAKAA